MDNPVRGVESAPVRQADHHSAAEGVNPVRKGRPWSLPLEDRVLLVAAYWWTNLTLRRWRRCSVRRSPQIPDRVVKWVRSWLYKKFGTAWTAPVC